jgi:hypothetical protein
VEAGLHRCDRLVLVGKLAPAEEPRQQSPAGLAYDDFVADEDVELPERPFVDLDLDAQALFQLGGETRRLGSVASDVAVEDPDVSHDHRVAHSASSAPWYPVKLADGSASA